MRTPKSVKGMNDLFEDELVTWRFVESCAAETFQSFGYGEIRTPLLEEHALFARGVGEGTDIVEKEMFSFDDGAAGKETRVSLRPEGTASVVRALIQAGRLPPDVEVRCFYTGPMFRRERPQKGRYRQFHQLGVEAFGVDSPSLDTEVMAMLMLFAERVGLTGLRLALNTLGDPEDRARYTADLHAYFTRFRDDLPDDAKERLEKNPLRLLDHKSERVAAIAADAPSPKDAIGDAARAHFDAVCEGLSALSIPFVLEDRLVRGLDYYTRTVFELLADAGLGAQNAVAAGGRYDGLVESLGHKVAQPAVGFAAGIERIVLLLQDAGRARAPVPPALFLVGADDKGRARSHVLAHQLRKAGVTVEVDHRGRKVKAAMKRADRSGARCALVLGERELDDGTVSLKILATGAVLPVPLDAAALARAIADAASAD